MKKTEVEPMPVANDNVNKQEALENGRGGWGNKWEFLLSCIGFAVGLGNIWRFPWLVQKNGGGAFLIPYFIMLFIEGLPLFYLELSIGQRLRCGPIPLWRKVSPYAVGIGFAMCIVSFLVACYYNVVITWCLYYLFSSFQNPLPWAHCPKVNVSGIMQDLKACEETGTTTYYWYYEALQIGTNLDDRSGLNWKLTLCLLAAWIIVSLCMVKGIESSGKVVWFSAIFPYVVLAIFFVRGLMLEGMEDGLIYLFKPKWEKLLDAQVWLDAASQIFFTLSLGFGGLIAYASYNPINENTMKDSLIITFTNCGTSIFAGVAVFSILGFRANNLEKLCLQEHNITSSYKQIPTECSKEKFLAENSGGTGLAFVALTEAINQMPGSIFFSILFFLMLVTLGLDSMFGSLEGLVSSMRDMKTFSNMRKEFVILTIAIPSFLIGLCFVQYSGEYVLQIFNSWSADLPLLIIAFFECIFISYIYGIDRFSDDIKMMNGSPPSIITKAMWMFVSPLAILVVLIAFLVLLSKERPTYSRWDKVTVSSKQEPYPDWAFALALLLTLCSVLFIPFGVLYAYIKRKQTKVTTVNVSMNEVARVNEAYE